MLYSIATVTLLAATKGIPPFMGEAYCFLCAMALCCHAKTSLTDPGSVSNNIDRSFIVFIFDSEILNEDVLTLTLLRVL